MRTVTFYSFKGGAGRSTALANVAYALAEQGANVGCMDLDLTSARLHMIFPDIGPAYLNAKKVHDHLKGDEGDIEDYIIDVRGALDEDDTLEGELQLIAGSVQPPGADDPMNMVTRLMELRTDFHDVRDLDYMLLNVEAGLGNHMVPAFDSSDDFLFFQRWTPVHKRGTDEIADWLQDIGVTLDNVMSVATDVPASVREEEVRDWMSMELYGVDDYHVIGSSDVLRAEEAVVTMSHPDTSVAEQYRELAEML